MSNRIWIELDKPKSEEHAQKQCELANKMLVKLGITTMHFWAGKRGYNITTDSAGSFLECSDRGHWFNLDHIAQ